MLSTVTPTVTPTDTAQTSSPSGTTQPPTTIGRRKTSHLKVVPESLELREQIRARCVEVAARLDKNHPLTKDEMETVARQLLEQEGMPEGYLGWVMVVLSSEFWRDQIGAIPPSRRLFLLPHCLKHAEGCPADYDEFGMNCKKCGACSIADFRTIAEEMGYKVLVAEGSPVVLKIIVSGYVDAIVGVACLNVLEKAIDKILLAGIPCMAVPLLSSDCRNTSVDESWVMDMIENLTTEPAAAQTRSYVHLLRAANDLFQPEQFDRLAVRQRGSKPIGPANGSDAHDQANGQTDAQAFDLLGGNDPIAATEALGYDFVRRGGKYSRPFITLAAYDALTGGRGTTNEGAASINSFPDAVRRAAMSIEMFHKASLVHDDIEDDDGFRYGQPTMHRRFGLPTAINVGDYLIGLGYRMVSRETATLGAQCAADIMDCLANAHIRLAEGQGAELLWRDARDRRLSPLDALKIYALKTAPAFEAALYTGVRLAGDATEYVEPIRQFARNLGVAFQILNDLNDWQGDQNNKLASGGDVLGGRPTVLWALALASLNAADQAELMRLASADCELVPAERVRRIERLYRQAKAFDQANRLIDKHQQRALEVVRDVAPEALQRLMIYLVDTVLERNSEAPAAVVPLSQISSLPMPTRS
ncbi:MAG: polyprenyl synthetase family protein [Pirellulaceae bacterium]|nr:polyprenyl synthetase family protein [Pirellulaceae bacterium]